MKQGPEMQIWKMAFVQSNYILQMLLATTSKQDTKEQPWKMMCTAELRWPNRDKKKTFLDRTVAVLWKRFLTV